MKKSPFYGGEEREGSPRAKKSNLSPATRICFERETIVHTHCSKFREVVHQLTGAESLSNEERSPPFVNGLSRHENVLTNDCFTQDVGISSRHSFRISGHENAHNNGGLGRNISTINNIKDQSFELSCLENVPNSDGFIKGDSFQSSQLKNVVNSDGSVQDFVSSSSYEMNARSDPHASGKTLELEANSPLGLRLFERRKLSNNNKSVGRLSTSCKDLPALVSGPLTPLACEFEKICFSRTPTDCPDNNPMPISSKGGIYGDIQMSSSTDPRKMDISLSVTRAMNTEPDTDNNHNSQPSAEDVAIAEKGFFLHSERPRSSELTLLSLFPESPRNL